MPNIILKPALPPPQPVGLSPMSGPPYMRPAESAALRHLWFAIFRRKWQVITIVLLTVLPTALYNFVATPYYSSSATIQIDPESAKVLPYKSVDETDGAYNDFNLYFRTQVEILKGDKLSDRVASRLGTSPIARRASASQNSFGERVQRYYEAAKRRFSRSSTAAAKPVFDGGIDVRPIANTRLVALSYSSPDPAFSAKAVNIAAEEFIKLHFSEKEETAERTVEFLNAQLNVLRVKVESAEESLIDYARENGILNLSDKEQDVIRQRLDKLNDQMTQVEARFIAKSANYNAIKAASSADLPSSFRAGNSNISDLEGRLADLEQKIANLTSQFGENWPDLGQARKELARVQQQLVKEREATYSRALQQASMEYESARQEFRMLSKALQDQKDATNRLNKASVQYNNLKRDVDMNQQLYQALLQRLKESGVTTGLQFGNVYVVQQAKPAGVPSSPRTAVNLMLALMLGLMLGLGLAFFNEYLDRSVKTVDDLEEFTGLPALASLPLDAKMKQGLDPAQDRKLLPLVVSLDLSKARSGSSYVNSQSQAFREACLHLRASILLANPDRAPQVILMTSAIPLEGKTTVATQLANVLARADAHTILLDLDMRRPELSRRFGVNGNHEGMSVFLSGNSPVVSDLVQTDNPYLLLAPAGPKPPNPADLIGSERMKLALEQLRKQFRFIVIDTPPILTVADAMALAPLVDGVVLVVRAGQTPREIIFRAIAEMRRGGGRILGMVFNGVDVKSPDHYYSQKYYGYSHYENSN